MEELKLVDNSQIKSYQACPFYFYLRYIRRIKRTQADEMSVDKEFGSKTHEFLEKYYKKEPTNITELWSNYREIKLNRNKTKDGGIELCRQYHERWNQADKNFNVIDTEKKLFANILGHTFVAKSDTIITYNDEFYVLEHKTTGNLSKDYFNCYDIDAQIDSNIFCCIENYGSCSGVILNVLEIKSLMKKPKTKSIERNFYTQQYMDDITDKPRYRVIHFERQTFTRTMQHIEDWKNQTVAWINLIRYAIQNKSFPKAMSAGSCSSYKGCQYKAICLNCEGLEVDDVFLEDEYHLLDNKFEYLELTPEERVKYYGD